MKRRTIIPFLVLVALTGWWALHDDRTPKPESQEASPAGGTPEQVAAAHAGDPLGSVALEPPIEARPSTSSEPLTRQRDRLRDTAIRLAARRDQAQAAGAPEATIRALDAHLERVEQRLAALDVMPRAGFADLGASRDPVSPVTGP